MVLGIVQVLNPRLTDGDATLILYNVEKAVKLKNLFKSFYFLIKSKKIKNVYSVLKFVL